MRRRALSVFLTLALVAQASRLGSGQAPRPAPAQASRDAAVSVLRPARVFDGDTMHEGWAVRVRGDRIEAAGPAAGVNTPGATAIDVPGTTLMPGMVEGHSH